MLSRRLVPCLLGALALTLSGSAAWHAQAESANGVTASLTTFTPNPVASQGKVNVSVTATSNVGTITAVNLRAGSIAVALRRSGSAWTGQLTAPRNATRNNVNLPVSVVVQRNAGNPRVVTVPMKTILTVRGTGTPTPPPGPTPGRNPNQPPPPPGI